MKPFYIVLYTEPGYPKVYSVTEFKFALLSQARHFVKERKFNGSKYNWHIFKYTPKEIK